MLNNKDIKKILPASKVTLQRIIKNIGKGSQQILNVKSKIQNYTANSSFYLNITNIYTQQVKDCKKIQTCNSSYLWSEICSCRVSPLNLSVFFKACATSMCYSENRLFLII